MHDGYLFTLGICGSAEEDDPAPVILNQLLAALPPVKRAAFLGRLPSDQPDQLLADVVADMRDAELIIIVAPATTPQLPNRLDNLLRATYAAGISGRYALLVTIGRHAPAVLQQLQAVTATCGLMITAAHALADHDPPPVTSAQAAYATARTNLAPNALPRSH